MAEKKSRGCLKIGCLGCVVVAGLAVIGAACIILLAMLVDAPEENRQQRELIGDPPAAALKLGEALERGAEAGGPVALLPPVDEPGRVVLDLSMGRFEILRGEPGEPVRVEAEYDTASYELEDSYESYGNSGWIYRVRFGNKLSWFRRLYSSQDADNLVRIKLPPNVPLTLEGQIGVGESDFELGGLWLVDVDLGTNVGEHHLRFSTPLQQPLKRFALDANVGEARVWRLGNASPAQVDVAQNIGELVLDLNGAWLRDSRINLSSNIGASRLVLPENVHVEVARASVNIGDSNLRAVHRRPPAPEGAPRLTLTLDHNIGELRLEN